MKQCTKCNKIKPLSEYYRQQTTKDGLQYYCKKCSLEDVKTRYHKNPKKQLSRIFAKKYGITPEQQQKMIAAQNGQCDICKETLQTGRYVHQDHCHETNILRGVLCRSCNLGLGHFKDSMDILKSALAYKEKYLPK